MTEPKRIQRRRTKGWRMPEGAVYVARPSRWGNEMSIGGRMQPVRVGDGIDQAWVWHLRAWREADTRDGVTTITPALAVYIFRAEVGGWNHDFRQRYLEPLRGHDLVCWCPLDQPCHADVLLELANP